MTEEQPCFCYSIKCLVDVFELHTAERGNGNERE